MQHALRKFPGYAWLVTATLFTAGCQYSSYDELIRVGIERSELVVDPANPDQLATITITATLTAGSRVDHDAILGITELRDDGPEPAATLKLGFPADFAPHFGANESKQVEIHNVGTTNAELSPFCDRTLALWLMLADPDSEGDYHGTNEQVLIQCPSS